MGLTIGMAVVGTVVLGTAVKATIGLRLDPECEEDGLDLLDHGEAGYHLDDAGSVAILHRGVIVGPMVPAEGIETAGPSQMEKGS
jgi:hypothetical protein